MHIKSGIILENLNKIQVICLSYKQVRHFESRSSFITPTSFHI